jgi:hypothetical protein
VLEGKEVGRSETRLNRGRSLFVLEGRQLVLHHSGMFRCAFQLSVARSAYSHHFMQGMIGRANLGHFLFLRRLGLGVGGHVISFQERKGNAIVMKGHAVAKTSGECRSK